MSRASHHKNCGYRNDRREPCQRAGTGFCRCGRIDDPRVRLRQRLRASSASGMPRRDRAGVKRPRPVTMPDDDEIASAEPAKPTTVRLVLNVSIKRQRVTVYDANGLVTEAPISSGPRRLCHADRRLHDPREEPDSFLEPLRLRRRCRTCSASPGREWRFTPARSPAIRLRTAASGCPTASRRSFSG